MDFDFDRSSLYQYVEELDILELAADNETTLSVISCSVKPGSTASKVRDLGNIALSDLPLLYSNECPDKYKQCQYSIRDRLAFYVNAVQNTLRTYSQLNADATQIFDTNNIGLYNCITGVQFNTNPQHLQYVACFSTRQKGINPPPNNSNAKDVFDYIPYNVPRGRNYEMQRSEATETIIFGGIPFKRTTYYINSRDIYDFILDFLDRLVLVLASTRYQQNYKFKLDNNSNKMPRYLNYNIIKPNVSSKISDTIAGNFTFLLQQNIIYKALNVDIDRYTANINGDIVKKSYFILALYNFYVTLYHVVKIHMIVDFQNIITSTITKFTIINTLISTASHAKANTQWFQSLAAQLASSSEWVVMYSPFLVNRWASRNIKQIMSDNISDASKKFHIDKLYYVADDNFQDICPTFQANELNGSNGVFSYYFTTAKHYNQQILTLSQFQQKYKFDNIISVKNILHLIDDIFIDWLEHINCIQLNINICHSNCHINTITQSTGEYVCVCGHYEMSNVTKTEQYSISEGDVPKIPSGGNDDEQ